MSLASYNGRILEGPVPLDPRDRGLTLGDGLFETLLVVNGVALWRHMHMARMQGAANELGIAFNRDGIDDAVDALLAIAAPGHHVLRVTLTRGTAARGLGGNSKSPTLLVTLDPFDAKLMFRPVSLLTSSVRRSPHSPACRLKTLSYIDNIAAAREAAAKGLEDALLLNTDGHVACSTIANVFLIGGGRLITPARDQAILTGVMRQTLLAAAHHLHLACEERVVTPAELHRAEAVFLTNSLRFIRPVAALDGQKLGTGDLKALADALCETARLQCGSDPRLI